MTERYTKLVALPPRGEINRSSDWGQLRALKQATMLDTLGHPRSARDYTDSCQSVSNESLKRDIATSDLGPFRATGHRWALAVFREALIEVRRQEPELYGLLGSAGMLCVRRVRGTTIGSISNHSWGMAIDFTIAGKLDAYGDDRCQAGLITLAEIFAVHGIFWGAAFAAEDSMHFELSEQVFRARLAARRSTTPGVHSLPPEVLSVGDRGPQVEQLQRLLNVHQGAKLLEDGKFGAVTRATVEQFQRDSGLEPDGRVTTSLLSLIMELK